MTYYRLAIQNQQTALWTWKSTVVTSLEAVFQLLRIYRALPQDRVRVFSSASKEELALALLDSEKNSLTVCSVTAAEFSHARQLQIYDGAYHGFDGGTAQPNVQFSTTVTLASSWPVDSVAPASLAASGVNDLEKRRLEQEMGPGGDHDLPYTFMLPPTLAQVRVWIQLFAQVQMGELQPWRVFRTISIKLR
jgi:hypothetical protein